MDEVKLKGCPLLVQSDTYPSLTMSAESHTRSYFLPCIGKKCVAYMLVSGHKVCQRFDAIVEYKEDPEPQHGGK